MSHYRDEFLERWLDQVRLYVAGIAFFLLNVLLGVVGTFWYRTQQRSAEIGLRMAMGATRKGIFWQLVKEGLALLTVAFIPSAIIFANLLYMEVTQGSLIPPGHGLAPVVRLRVLVRGDGRDDCRGNQFPVLPGHADASGGRLAAGMIGHGRHGWHGHPCPETNRLFGNESTVR